MSETPLEVIPNDKLYSVAYEAAHASNAVARQNAANSLAASCTALRQQLAEAQQERDEAQRQLSEAEKEHADDLIQLVRHGSAERTRAAYAENRATEAEAALAQSQQAMKALIETTTRLSCGHDGCYGQSEIVDGQWRFLHCWQCRAELAESRLSALTQAVKELARYEPVGNHMVTAIDGQNLKRADVIAAISPRPEAARDTRPAPTIDAEQPFEGGRHVFFDGRWFTFHQDLSTDEIYEVLKSLAKPRDTRTPEKV